MASIKKLDDQYQKERASILQEDGNLFLTVQDGPSMTLGPRIASNVGQVVECLEISISNGSPYSDAGMRFYHAAKAYHDAIQAAG